MMCCYFPAATILIDDDVEFLKNTKHFLSLPNCQIHTSPHEIFERLTQQNGFERILSRLLKRTCISSDTTLNHEYQTFFVDPMHLYEEIYHADRFNDVSVLVIDYYMEDINGVDVCQKLEDHPSKKILLTGGVEMEKIAIDAFNKGIIHRYINKSDKNFPTLLKQSIDALKQAYFRDLTKKLLPYLPIESSQLLQNLSYINFVRIIQDQVQAREYYLIDTSGSILFLDANRLPTWLIIKSEKEFLEFEQIASDTDAPVEITKSIKSRKAMPFLFTSADFQEPTTKWNKHLYDAQCIPHTNGFYYSLITNNIGNYIDIKNIINTENII